MIVIPSLLGIANLSTIYFTLSKVYTDTGGPSMVLLLLTLLVRLWLLNTVAPVKEYGHTSIIFSFRFLIKNRNAPFTSRQPSPSKVYVTLKETNLLLEQILSF